MQSTPAAATPVRAGNPSNTAGLSGRALRDYKTQSMSFELDLSPILEDAQVFAMIDEMNRSGNDDKDDDEDEDKITSDRELRNKRRDSSNCTIYHTHSPSLLPDQSSVQQLQLDPPSCEGFSGEHTGSSIRFKNSASECDSGSQDARYEIDRQSTVETQSPSHVTSKVDYYQSDDSLEYRDSRDAGMSMANSDIQTCGVRCHHLTFPCLC